MCLDQPSVVFVGRVDDILEPLGNARICVSPLISGAGFRGKINQYSAVGRPTVSTSIGVSGTPYVNGESVVIADRPEAFNHSFAGLHRTEQRRRLEVAFEGDIQEVVPLLGTQRIERVLFVAPQIYGGLQIVDKGFPYLRSDVI